MFFLETYTIEQAIEQLGYGRFQFRVSCIAGLAWVSLSSNSLLQEIV